MAKRLILPILLVLICATGYALSFEHHHRTLFVNNDDNDQRSLQKRNTVTFHSGDETESEAGFRTMNDYVQLHRRMRRDAAEGGAAASESPTNKTTGSSNSSTTKLPVEDEKKIIPKVTWFFHVLCLIVSTNHLTVRFLISYRQPIVH